MRLSKDGDTESSLVRQPLSPEVSTHLITASTAFILTHTGRWEKVDGAC